MSGVAVKNVTALSVTSVVIKYLHCLLLADSR